MDEARIREIVQEELGRARARRAQRAAEVDLGARVRAALAELGSLEVTTAQLLTMAGVPLERQDRAAVTIAGTALRREGWTVVRRDGSGARARHYSKPARAA